MHEVLATGATHAMLVNDDLHFVAGGFSAFVDFARAHDPLSVAFLQGLETGGSPYAGQVMQQGFALLHVDARSDRARRLVRPKYHPGLL